MSKLTIEQKQMISDYADGESVADEVIELLLNSAEAKQWLQQIQQQKEQLLYFKQTQPVPKASDSLFERISRAVDEEETYQIDTAQNKQPTDKKEGNHWLKRWLNPVGGLAVAATVATVAVTGVTTLQTASNNTQPATLGVASIGSSTTTNGASVQTFAPQVRPVSIVGTYDGNDRSYWQGSEPAVQEELNRYLVDHSEYATPGGFNSIVPYVRIAGYDDEQ